MILQEVLSFANALAYPQVTRLTLAVDAIYPSFIRLSHSSYTSNHTFQINSAKPTPATFQIVSSIKPVSLHNQYIKMSQQSLP